MCCKFKVCYLFRHITIQCIFTIRFFFSSRRRHTRSKRDWSSDVCSSDLASKSESEHKHHLEILFRRLTENGLTINERSEERRVGKHCRFQCLLTSCQK